MNSLYFLLLIFFGAGNNTTPVKYLCHHRLDEVPGVETDVHIQGIWKLKEDTNYNNYFIVERDGDKRLSVTYMNRGGDNRGLEHFGAFFSEVNGVKFLNAPYSSFSTKPDFSGSVLLRLDEVNDLRSWNVTMTLVTDTNLYKMNSSAELRKYVEGHMNAPGFYGKQLHFKKKFEFNSFR